MTKAEVGPTLRELMFMDPKVIEEEALIKQQKAARRAEQAQRSAERRVQRGLYQKRDKGEDFPRNHFDVHPL